MSTTIVRIPVDQALWSTLRAAACASLQARLNELRLSLLYEALPCTDQNMLIGRALELQPLIKASAEAEKAVDDALDALVRAEIAVRLGDPPCA